MVAYRAYAEKQGFAEIRSSIAMCDENILTPAQQQIADLVTEGYSDKAIEKKLNKNHSTIHSHLAQIKDKLLREDNLSDKNIRVVLALKWLRIKQGAECEKQNLVMSCPFFNTVIASRLRCSSQFELVQGHTLNRELPDNS